MKRLTLAALAVFVALTAVASGDEITKRFPPLDVKRAGHTFSITPSLRWNGEKDAKNAQAELFVSETGASGRVTMASILMTMSPDELRRLHNTLGSMLKELDSDGVKQKKKK